jgi:hypothetical protein
MESLLIRFIALGVFLAFTAAAQAPNPSPGSYGNWLPGSSQKGGKGDDPNVRSVTGTVKSSEDAFVEGAVVQIKNTKTAQIRSFITKADGVYSFQSLSTNVDYELKAEAKGWTSPVRTLSTFDDRKRAIIHLKLENKKQ